jgi:hypothetical protein
MAPSAVLQTMAPAAMVVAQEQPAPIPRRIAYRNAPQNDCHFHTLYKSFEHTSFCVSSLYTSSVSQIPRSFDNYCRIILRLIRFLIPGQLDRLTTTL